MKKSFITVNNIEVDDFTFAYLVCAIWTSHDDTCESFYDNHMMSDLAVETINKAKEDCSSFLEKAKDILSQIPETYSINNAGHDFWLTRNHHGAGYWDRSFGDLGKELTKIAEKFGECDLYKGDDGALYML